MRRPNTGPDLIDGSNDCCTLANAYSLLGSFNINQFGQPFESLDQPLYEAAIEIGKAHSAVDAQPIYNCLKNITLSLGRGQMRMGNTQIIKHVKWAQQAVYVLSG